MTHVKNEGIEILRVLCGSRAYGLETETSDYDYHGVFVVPTSHILSLGSKIKETAWLEGEGSNEDNTAWELGHFLTMATQCNPTVLETFVAPVMYVNDYGSDLLALFPYVLNRKRIFDAFRGYAKNQRTKMFDPPPGTGDPVLRQRKAAIAYLRSLYHGAQLLYGGTYMPRIPKGEFRDFLMEMKRGKPYLYEIVKRAEYLEDDIVAAYAKSPIRQEPDYDRINAFLLRVRRELWA